MTRAIVVAAICTVGLVSGCTGSLTLWHSGWAVPVAGVLAVSALFSTVVLLALASRRLLPITDALPPIAPEGTSKLFAGRWRSV